MLVEEISKEMIEKYRKIFELHRSKLKPNRKSGKEVDEYFRSKYKPTVFDSYEFKQMVCKSIVDNEYEREKLIGDSNPQVVAYLLDENIGLFKIDSFFLHIYEFIYY